MLNSSIEEYSCENYLFKDYHLKSDITIWIFTLKSSGRTNLFYPPKYFREEERESKMEQNRGEKTIYLDRANFFMDDTQAFS